MRTEGMDTGGGYAAFRGGRGREQDFWTDVNGWVHLQAVQWEPFGRRLLAELGDGSGRRAVDFGCGGLGWLRLLSEWVGRSGTVVGTEVSDSTADPARLTVRNEALANVEVVVDDVFHSALDDRSFDLVHARNLLGPVGRPEEQLATFERVVRPGGWLVLEDLLNFKSWSFNPAGSAPANERIRDLMVDWVVGTFGRKQDMGSQIRTLLSRYDPNPLIKAETLVLPPGHAYRALPLMFATGFREGMRDHYGAEMIDDLFTRAHEELDDPQLWCTSYTLIQGCARMP